MTSLTFSTELLNDVHFSTSERMSEVPSSSVQAVICSPPYWDLKDYGHPEQIGHGESYQRYHERMNSVWKECHRVLVPSGTMWIVVDKIWKSGGLVIIPFDIARHCEQMGFFLQDIIVWNKPTAIAGMTRRNIVNKFEYVLFFTKEWAGFKFNQLGEIRRHQPDFDPRTGRLTNLWRFPVKAGSIRKTPDHKAPYPDELISRIVRISTDERDTILDPYLGSGTTLKVSLELNRRCIGYEINRVFESVIAERVKGLQPNYQQAKLE